MKVGDRVRVVVNPECMDIVGFDGKIVGKDGVYDWWVRLDLASGDIALNENELEVIDEQA